jgi:enoyl-[acyl-carrier protein] reductase II
MNIFERLGCQYPIIQGAMSNVAFHQLVAAVSNAGGLGILQAGGWNADQLREEVRKIKQLTDKPFGMNVLLVSPHAEAIAKMAVEEAVPVLTTGAGNPGIYMKMWKDAGIIVIPVVASVALAVRMERAGADAVICEGTESGGHIGELTTLVLVPQVADAVSIDVIAAGGIADSRGVLACLALGAIGVQCGTIFMASHECPIHINYKQAIVDAKDTSTTVTGRETGRPCRVIKNKMSKRYMEIVKEGIDLDRLEELTLGSLRKAAVEGDMENGSIMAGQSAGLVKEITSVKRIIENLFSLTPHIERLILWKR